MQHNIENILKSITAITSSNIEIIAATKTVAIDKINLLPNFGIVNAGENRVQEFLSKYDAANKNIKWHFIGSLQTNKVKYIVDKVECINSVDRISLALEINKSCQKINKIMPVLLQINAGGENSKSGVKDINGLNELYNFIKQNCPFVKVVGLMPVLPINAKDSLYSDMHNLFKEFSKSHRNDITVLSMGMSDDYLSAIKHGATQIRLGSCIFGDR